MAQNRVDFFVVGAQRCGTTFLSNALAGLEAVEFCSVKEPFFFTQAEDWRESIEEYHNLFCFDEDAINGEGSTHYTMIPKYKPVYRDIYEYNPEAKIIYSVRDPVERAVSLFTYYHGGRTSDTQLTETIEHNIEYLCAGMYYRQIAPYIEQFGWENVHIVVFEDMVARPTEVIQQAAGFLGTDEVPAEIHDDETNASEENYAPSNSVSQFLYQLYGHSGIHRYIPDSLIEVGKQHVLQTSQKPDPSASLKMKLTEFFEEDIRGVEKLLDRNLQHWRHPE